MWSPDIKAEMRVPILPQNPVDLDQSTNLQPRILLDEGIMLGA